MVIVLSGENAFSLNEELRQISADFSKAHGELALERLDGEEASLEQIREALTALPFLASKKLVILRTPSKNKGFVEQFESLLSDLPETNDVVIVEPKLDKRLSLYKYLNKQTDFREFRELDQRALSSWLVKAASNAGGNLSNKDALYLVERLGLNQQLLYQELNKLLLYSLNITRESIDLLTEATPQSSIFQLLEAAFAGRPKEVLSIYEEQRELKTEPPQIIAMLAWQLQVLVLIKTAGERSASEIAKTAKLNPFVVNKRLSLAHRLNYAYLKTLVKDLLNIDLSIKSINIDADEALKQYLLKLALQ